MKMKISVLLFLFVSNIATATGFPTHRDVTSPSDIEEMIYKKWVNEGTVFCTV